MSSIPFRLLNRDKFSFRPHVFFGVVKVVFRKKYFETNIDLSLNRFND